MDLRYHRTRYRSFHWGRRQGPRCLEPRSMCAPSLFFQQRQVPQACDGKGPPLEHHAAISACMCSRTTLEELDMHQRRDDLDKTHILAAGNVLGCLFMAHPPSTPFLGKIFYKKSFLPSLLLISLRACRTSSKSTRQFLTKQHQSIPASTSTPHFPARNSPTCGSPPCPPSPPILPIFPFPPF